MHLCLPTVDTSKVDLRKATCRSSPPADNPPTSAPPANLPTASSPANNPNTADTCRKAIDGRDMPGDAQNTGDISWVVQSIDTQVWVICNLPGFPDAAVLLPAVLFV